MGERMNRGGTLADIGGFMHQRLIHAKNDKALASMHGYSYLLESIQPQNFLFPVNIIRTYLKF